MWCVIGNVTCSPVHQCTLSSSCGSPGLTAYCESFCVFSSGSFLRTDWKREKFWDKGDWEQLKHFRCTNEPWWVAVGRAESRPPWRGVSSRPHWESVLGWTVGMAAEAGGEAVMQMCNSAASPFDYISFAAVALLQFPCGLPAASRGLVKLAGHSHSSPNPREIRVWQAKRHSATRINQLCWKAWINTWSFPTGLVFE